MTPEGKLTYAELRAIARDLRHGDDSAARAHLAAGQPIVYRETDTPAGHVIQQHPNGRRELLRYVDGRETVVRELPSAKPLDSTP